MNNLRNLKLVNDDESFVENSYIELSDLNLKSINHLESLRLMLLRKISLIVMKKTDSQIICNKKFSSFGNGVKMMYSED